MSNRSKFDTIDHIKIYACDKSPPHSTLFRFVESIDRHHRINNAYYDGLTNPRFDNRIPTLDILGRHCRD